MTDEDLPRFMHFKVRPGVWEKFRETLTSRRLPGVLAEDAMGKVERVSFYDGFISSGGTNSARAQDILKAVTERPGTTAFRVSAGSGFEDVLIGNRREIRKWIRAKVVESVMRD